MKRVRLMTLALAVALFAGHAGAQPGKGMGAGQGAGPMNAGAAASAPGMGAGGGRGAMRWGPDNTPGWSLMTPQERTQHREKMMAMKTREECNAYVAQHRGEMAARAQERGVKVPAMPRRDPCARLPQ